MAVALDMDETGVACRSHGRTFGVARFGVCRRVEPGEVGELEWNPASCRSEVMEIWPSSALGKRGCVDEALLASRGGVSEWSFGRPDPAVDGNSGP